VIDWKCWLTDERRLATLPVTTPPCSFSEPSERLASPWSRPLPTFSGCERSASPEKDRVVIEYWEKWTGFEADAIRTVVDDFNASQDRIYVNYSSVSQIDHKLMLATAGGVPPDVAGVYARMLPVYSENNALTPLDDMAAAAHITRDQYIAW